MTKATECTHFEELYPTLQAQYNYIQYIITKPRLSSFDVADYYNLIRCLSGKIPSQPLQSIQQTMYKRIINGK